MCSALAKIMQDELNESKLAGKIELLLEEGKSITEIARRLKLSEDEVTRIIANL